MIRFARSMFVAYVSSIVKVLKVTLGDVVFYDDQDLLYRVTVNGATSESYCTTQYGLRLPDGRVIWPPDEYKGFPVDTPAQRGILLQVLQKSAGELSFTEEAFCQHYKWVRRTLAITVKEEGKEELSIDTPAAFADDLPASTRDGAHDIKRDETDEACDNTTVHEGPVGSPAR